MSSNIRQVADLAKVSIATVSRYLNNSSCVSAESSKRIEYAIKKLNYKPNNSHHKVLCKNILVVLPSITNPFFSEIYGQLSKELLIAGYTTTLLLDNNLDSSIDSYLSYLSNKTY